MGLKIDHRLDIPRGGPVVEGDETVAAESAHPAPDGDLIVRFAGFQNGPDLRSVVQHTSILRAQRYGAKPYGSTPSPGGYGGRGPAGQGAGGPSFFWMIGKHDVLLPQHLTDMPPFQPISSSFPAKSV